MGEEVLPSDDDAMTLLVQMVLHFLSQQSNSPIRSIIKTICEGEDE